MGTADRTREGRCALSRVGPPAYSVAAVALAAANLCALAARALASAALRLASTSGSVIGLRCRRGLASGNASMAAPRSAGQAAERRADLNEMRPKPLVEGQQLGVLVLQRLVSCDELGDLGSSNGRSDGRQAHRMVAIDPIPGTRDSGRVDTRISSV